MVDSGERTRGAAAALEPREILSPSGDIEFIGVDAHPATTNATMLNAKSASDGLIPLISPVGWGNLIGGGGVDQHLWLSFAIKKTNVYTRAS